MATILFQTFNDSFYNRLANCNPDIVSIIGLNFDNVFTVIDRLSHLNYQYKINNVSGGNITLLAWKGTIREFKWVVYSNSPNSNGILFVNVKVNDMDVTIANTIFDIGFELSQSQCLTNFFKETDVLWIHYSGKFLGDWDTRDNTLFKGITTRKTGEFVVHFDLED